MLADDLKEKLKSIEPDLEVVKTFFKNAKIEEEFKSLYQISTQEDFWQHKDQTSILKKLQKMKNLTNEYHHIIDQHKELNDLVSLFENDEDELSKITQDINRLIKNIKQFKVNLLLSDPQDDAGCFLSINAGAGGT